MNILILEDEPRNAKRLIRLLNDIDRTFIVEGPLASIKETVEFFQSGKTTNLILADIRLTDGLSFEALKYAPATIPIIFTTAYNPQIQISAESETKRSIFREKDKTKRSKKESAQHSKSRNKSFVMTSVSAL